MLHNKRSCVSKMFMLKRQTADRAYFPLNFYVKNASIKISTLVKFASSLQN